MTNGTTFRLNTPVVESYVTPHTSVWFTTNSPGYFYNTLNDGFQLTGGYSWVASFNMPMGWIART